MDEKYQNHGKIFYSAKICVLLIRNSPSYGVRHSVIYGVRYVCHPDGIRPPYGAFPLMLPSVVWTDPVRMTNVAYTATYTAICNVFR